MRSRSRTSSCSKKSSQFSLMARSSSSCASWPVAMMPPSRTSAAGSGLMAFVSRSTQPSGGLQCTEIWVSRAAMPGNDGASCCAFDSAVQRATSSRGRTWRNAMRAAMRSTSLMFFNCSRSVRQGAAVLPGAFACSAAMASSRACASSRSRRGDSNQRFNRRLPIPVMQVSSKEKSVGESSPRKVCTSSRFRRVVGGSSISSPSRSTERRCTCGSVRPCVCSA